MRTARMSPSLYLNEKGGEVWKGSKTCPRDLRYKTDPVPLSTLLKYSIFFKLTWKFGLGRRFPTSLKEKKSNSFPSS